MTRHESRCAFYQHDRLFALGSALREDIVRFASFSPAYRPEVNFRSSISIFFQPEILCLFCYRIAHFLYVRGWKRLAHFVSRFNLIAHKANISPQSCIGPGCFLGHCAGTSFHGSAGRNLTMLSLAVCWPQEAPGGTTAIEGLDGPHLGDGVTVGGHAVIIGRITVGDNVKIAPTTRLAVDCPSDTIAVSAGLRPSMRPYAGPHFQ